MMRQPVEETQPPILRLRGVRREYARRGLGKPGTANPLVAVEDLSFSAYAGQVVGLLGPNGAGKTTTAKMISTLLVPTAGTIEVFGIDAIADPRRVRHRIGLILGGDRGLYDRLSGRDNLRYFAELYGLSARRGANRIDEVLEAVGLADRQDERVEQYSRGMRQRLHIARGLLHNPQLLLLDEPTIGVDPVGARELRVIVKRLREEGKTILLTTHYMYEAEELCDRVLVLNHGKLVADGTPGSLKERYPAGVVVLEGLAFGLAEEALQPLQERPEVHSVETTVQGTMQRIIAQVDRAVAGPEAACDLLVSLGVTGIAQRPPTLEDAYVAIISGTSSAASDG